MIRATTAWVPALAVRQLLQDLEDYIGQLPTTTTVEYEAAGSPDTHRWRLRYHLTWERAR